MAKLTKPTPFLLHWSQHVPMSDVQDPLGLGLRGSTRLASLLLFCITSITPRARYFSFIPWCIRDWQKRERGQHFAFGLRDAIAMREKALAMGCISHHGGKPCNEGGLVGSDNVAKWFAKGQKEIDLRELPFAKYPALGAYFNSLVNLGFFVTDDDTKGADEDEEEAKLTDLRVGGEIDAEVFAKKQTKLCDRMASLKTQMNALDRNRDEMADLVSKVFKFSQTFRDK